MSITQSDLKSFSGDPWLASKESFSGDHWLASKEKREEPEQVLMGNDIKPKEAEQSERSTAKRSELFPWNFHGRPLDLPDPLPAIECRICCDAHYTSACPYLVEIPPGVTIRNDTGFEICCATYIGSNNIGPRKVVPKPFSFLPPSPPRD